MRRMLLGALAALLVACGQGSGPSSQRAASNEACALIEDAAAIFGANADVVANEGDAPIAADCQFTSADGTRYGEVVLFNAQSLGAVTPQAQVATLATGWDGATETPLAAVEGLGEEAQRATDLPGGQTQIAFRKGANVVAVLGSSGDAQMSGDQIARALAAAAAAKLPAQ